MNQTAENVTPLNPPTVFLRLEQVEERVGLKKSKIYALLKDRAFPQPVSLGSRAVGWVAAEVEEWMQRRMKERNVQ